ncbi:MAG: ABC-F family ATP-binding cassette domain-containing protein [Streptococcaceae bacterium]|jgi:ATP-binding cassette subfamily F protein uup|nr:ABC-F family ATP-binding cassette domain-containing protein [Streptococcaceae bacterium]
MKELKVENLNKTYGEKTIFKGISFSIKEQERIGLIGINGTGKTSLLNILAQVDFADGDISPLSKPNDYTIGYLSQNIHLDDDLTVVEAVFQGTTPILKAVRQYELALIALENDAMNENVQKKYTQAEELMNKEDAWNAEAKAKSILNKLGITTLSKKIKELSGGQQKRVQLAQVLIENPDLLLLDEPTNHLDYDTIEWLQNFLTSYTGSVLLVTHDRYFLDNVTNRIFELANGVITSVSGNYQTYLEVKAKRDEESVTQAHKQKQLYKQELAWMRAGAKARTTKQQARINRFNDLKENMPTGGNDEKLEMQLAGKRLGKKVLEIKDGNYEVNGQTILENFKLLIQAGDRIGITGKNGSGKTTLLNILAGRLPLQSGVFEMGETVKIAYYTQQNEEMDPDKRMISYLQETAEQVLQKDGTTISVAEMLERFLFPRFMHGTKIGKLSGGEKRRLYLLKLLIGAPNVLLLDEPTNDLDIDTLTVLEDYIQTFNGSVIAVSHDRYFLDKTTQKVLMFEGNGEIILFFGQISQILLEIVKKGVPQTQENVKIENVEKTVSKVKTKLSYMEQKEWATIEDEMMVLEEEIEEIKAQMITFGSDLSKLTLLQKDLDAKDEALAQKYERWEYLSQYQEQN